MKQTFGIVSPDGQKRDVSEEEFQRACDAALATSPPNERHQPVPCSDENGVGHVYIVVGADGTQRHVSEAEFQAEAAKPRRFVWTREEIDGASHGCTAQSPTAP